MNTIQVYMNDKERGKHDLVQKKIQVNHLKEIKIYKLPD